MAVKSAVRSACACAGLYRLAFSHQQVNLTLLTESANDAVRRQLRDDPKGAPDVPQGDTHIRRDLAQDGVAFVRLLAARVGQIVTAPAAEIAGVPRQVQFANSSSAGLPVDDERADEPPAQTAEARTSRRQGDEV